MTTFADGLYQYGGVPVTPGVPGVGGPPTGNVFFVQTTNGVNAGAGKSPTSPYQTLPYALTQATASNGDIIYLMPGSAVTVSSATALAISVAGISIIGLGVGNARPTITLDTANTATIAVSAANVMFQNCIIVANFLSIAAAFTLTTAVGFKLIGCEFRETSAVLNFLNIIKSTGAANTIDDLYVANNVWNGLGTTSVNAFILTANDIDNAQIINNTVILARTADASILLTVTTGVLTNLICSYNNVQSQQTATTAGSLINVGGTTSTGLVMRNFAQTLTAAADKLYTVTVGLGAFENYVSGAIGASGFIIPARDT
jgi:hypothetical protein